MNDSKASADDGSSAVGRDVNAPVVNVKADRGSTVSVTVEQQTARELPSFLGAVIVVFSQQSLSEYARGPRRALPAEVIAKLEHNKLSQRHRAIQEYNQYVLVLEKAYLGVEQTNADARYLVRRKAGIAYQTEIKEACKDASIQEMTEYVKANADGIVQRVVDRLLDDYKKSGDVKVPQETAHLAISLIVADAVVECEVLERP
jgi:hypothetical protein